jgi:hypothetical protein
MTIDSNARSNGATGIGQQAGSGGPTPTPEHGPSRRGPLIGRCSWCKVDLKDRMNGLRNNAPVQPVAVPVLYRSVKHAVLNLNPTLYMPETYSNSGTALTTRIVKRLRTDFGELSVIRHTYSEGLTNFHAVVRTPRATNGSCGLIAQFFAQIEVRGHPKANLYASLVRHFRNQAGSNGELFFIIDHAQDLQESDLDDLRRLRSELAEDLVLFVPLLFCTAPTFLATC